MSNPDTKDLTKDDTKNLHLEAYKILVDMLKKDDTLSWQQNGILIAINGGLLTALGSIQPKDPCMIVPSLNIISVVICGLGIAICFFWNLISNRIESFYDHWYEQLKHLENTELRSIQVFTIADKFFKEKKVTIGDKPFKLSFMSGLIRMFTVIQFLTVLLMVVWLILGIYFIQKI